MNKKALILACLSLFCFGEMSMECEGSLHYPRILEKALGYADAFH